MIPEEHLEFFHTIWSRRTPFTFIFLAINIAMFLLMEYVGSTTDAGTLMNFGAKSNPEIMAGQWWRLLTPIFIHIGFLHLIFNSYALWMVGQQVEKLYGSAPFAILYIVTGIAGVFGSFVYHPDTMSAGASGAIMGLFGVLLVFGLRYRHSIPPFFKQTVGTGILPVILVNLFIGFTMPAIDNAAHLSGLAGGALLAAVVPFQKPGQRTHPAFAIVLAGLLAVVLASFYSVASTYHGGTANFVDTLNSAEKTFDESAQLLQQQRIGNLNAVRDKLAASIDQIREIPSMDSRVDMLMRDLRDVLEKQYALVQDIGRTRAMTFAHHRTLKENVERYRTTMKLFSEWVEREGDKYGIQMGNRH